MVAAVGKAFALQLLSTFEGGRRKEEEKERPEKSGRGREEPGGRENTNIQIANTIFQRSFMQSLKTVIRLQAVRPVKTWQG